MTARRFFVGATGSHCRCMSFTALEDLSPSPVGAEDWSAPELRTGSVVFVVGGAGAGASSVEWTSAKQPGEVDWNPCEALAVADGWCIHQPPAPGILIAIRYRRDRREPWSGTSLDRKRVRPATRRPVPPARLSAPAVEGSGRPGEPLRVSPGDWAGHPAPILSLQWLRNGVPVPGATGPVHVPDMADDGAEITCQVTGRNLSGRARTLSSAVTVTCAAPAARGCLCDEVFDQGSGVQRIAAAGDFAGDALVYSVEGAEAVIDPQTGDLEIPTDTAVSGAEVIVTARNSGGAARSRFFVTVEPQEGDPVPWPLLAHDIVLRETFADPDTGHVSAVFEFPGLADESVDAVEWTRIGPGQETLPGFAPVLARAGGGFVPMRGDRPGVAASWAMEDLARGPLHFRWRRAADAPWSPVSVAQTLPSATPLPQPGAWPWRPMIVRPEEMSGSDQADLPDLYPKGRYWGEGAQFAQGAARGLSDPDRVIWGQDIGSIRISRDDGRSWAILPNLGNPLLGGNSCAIDPADADVMFALMSAHALGESSPALNAAEGIYRSTDGGKHWSLKQPVPEVPYWQRYFQDGFACWPLAGGRAEQRVWRLLAMSQIQRQDLQPGSLWTSRNGGDTWQPGPALPDPMARAQQFSLVQHPTEEGTLLACTGAGPWTTLDGGETWRPAFEGRFTEECRSLWIDPDRPETVLLAITSDRTSEQGIWHSETGGRSWRRVLDGFNPSNFAVGPRDGAGIRTVFVHSIERRNPVPRVRDWDGTRFLGRDWIRAEVVKPLKNTREWGMEAISGEDQALFLPHPVDPDDALCHGRAVWWRTADRGRTWTISSTGFGGQSCRDAFFDTGDWRQIDFASADHGSIFTPNAGDWFVKSNVTGPSGNPKSQWGRMRASAGNAQVRYRSGTAITRLPDNDSVTDPAARGRRIMALGGASRQFIFTQNLGQEDWNDFIDLPETEGGGGSSRWLATWSRQNPNVVYCGNSVSTDGAGSWGQTDGGISVIAMSHRDGDVVYGQADRNTVVKSLDRGSTWLPLPYHHARWQLTTGTGQPAFWLSPHDDRRAFTWGQGRDLVMLYGDPGRVAVTDMALRRQYSPPQPGFRVAEMGFSGQDPRLIYVLADVSGAPAVWAGYFSPDFSRIDWQDITGNGPRLAQSNDLAVHPQTGDVFVMGGLGIWVLPPPGGPRAASVWANCPRPIPESGLPAPDR